MPCARGCCGSQREHYLSVRLSAEATPSSKAVLVEQLERDKRVKADCAAYRRLVKAGMDNHKVEGSADRESKLS